jgi:hypothetical protein
MSSLGEPGFATQYFCQILVIGRQEKKDEKYLPPVQHPSGPNLLWVNYPPSGLTLTLGGPAPALSETLMLSGLSKLHKYHNP